MFTRFFSCPTYWVGVRKERTWSTKTWRSSFVRTYDDRGNMTLPGLFPRTGHRCLRIPASFMSRRAPRVSFSPNMVFMIFSAMFFSQCMTSNVCRIRRSCTVTPASHKLDSMHYTITVYSHIPRHITALSHKLHSMNQNITVHSHIPRHITAFSHNLDSTHHNITVYSHVTVQDCVRYTYFPIRKVKETVLLFTPCSCTGSGVCPPSFARFFLVHSCRSFANCKCSRPLILRDGGLMSVWPSKLALCRLHWCAIGKCRLCPRYTFFFNALERRVTTLGPLFFAL